MAKGEEGARASATPLLPLLIAPRDRAEGAGRGGHGINCTHDPRTPRLPRSNGVHLLRPGISTVRLGRNGSARVLRPGSGGPQPAATSHHALGLAGWPSRLAPRGVRTAGSKPGARLACHLAPATTFRNHRTDRPVVTGFDQSALQKTDGASLPDHSE